MWPRRVVSLASYCRLRSPIAASAPARVVTPVEAEVHALVTHLAVVSQALELLKSDDTRLTAEDRDHILKYGLEAVQLANHNIAALREWARQWAREFEG